MTVNSLVVCNVDQGGWAEEDHALICEKDEKEINKKEADGRKVLTGCCWVVGQKEDVVVKNRWDWVPVEG